MDQTVTTFSSPRQINACIFIVDEDRDIQTMLTMALEMNGPYRVYSFSHLADALLLAGSILPDVFLIDYELSPTMTGLELYQRLQAKSEYVPCILLSAPRSLVTWNNHPLWNLQEPFEIDDLLKSVQEALQASWSRGF